MHQYGTQRISQRIAGEGKAQCKKRSEERIHKAEKAVKEMCRMQFQGDTSIEGFSGILLQGLRARIFRAAGVSEEDIDEKNEFDPTQRHREAGTSDCLQTRGAATILSSL